MAAIKAGNAGRLSIEIVAEVARLEADMAKIKRVVNAASTDIARDARAANDNLRSIGAGASGNVVQFSREVARLKANMDPAWASLQRYKDQVKLLRQALAEGAITHAQFVAEMRNAVGGYKAATAASNSATAGISNVGSGAKLARHHVQNLAFQANDLGVQLMAAAQSSNPMKMAMIAIVQQGSQVAGIMSQAEIGIGGLIRVIGSAVAAMGPYIAILAAAYVALRLFMSEVEDNAKLDDYAKSLGLTADELKKLGDAHITLGDVAGGLWDYWVEKITEAADQGFGYFNVTASEVWGSVVDITKRAVNIMVGVSSLGLRLIVNAFTLMPAAISSIFSSIVNSIIDYINGLIQKATANINIFLIAIKSALGDWGKGINTIGEFHLDKMKSDGGKGAKAYMEGLGNVLKDTGTRDFLGEAADQLGGKIIDRAKKRLSDQAKKIIDDRKEGPKEKTGRDKSDDQAKELERLAKLGDRAAESIQRITEKYDEQPRLIDQVAQSTRELNKIIADLTKSNIKGKDGKGIFDDLIAKAQQAKEVVANGLMKPFNDYIKDQQQSMDIQRLTLTGREDEAQVMQVMLRLQEQFGTEEQLRAKVQEAIKQNKLDEAAIYQRMLDMYPQMRAQIAANIEKERELNDLLEKRQAIIGAYSSSISSVRSDLEGLLGGQLSGKDFLKNLKSNYQQLQGKLLTEQLFGGPLRALEDQIRKSTVIDTGVADMKAGMSDAGQEAHNLAAAFSGLRGSMGGDTGTAGASGVYVSSGAEMQDFVAALSDFDGAFDENSEIVITAKKTAATSQKAAVGVAGMKPGQYADMLAGVMVDPLVKALQNLGIDLSNTLSGALSGYMQAGVPGGIIGGLKGFMKDSGGKLFGDAAASGIVKGLDRMMGGAQTGTMAAGLMKSLGIKTSKTGAQIGGAIGGLTNIPGLDIVGSILGGIVGGALKKTKWARADVSGVSNDPYYRSNSGKYESGVSDAAKAVIDGLNSIADQLGGVAGEFASISIGIRDGSWRVNTNGKSLKTSGGAKDFGEDSAAAIAYAIQTAVQRGAISGINQSVLNLLQASGDFEEQLSKAAQLQNIFAEIAQSADPMGYELDQLAKKFVSINALLAEANATQEEYDQVAAYQKQQEAAIQQRYAEEAAAKRATQLEKEAELLTLQGKATQALAKSREAELLQMDAATQAIQKQIYAETDLATKRALQIQLLEAQGNAEAAKAAQRAEDLRSTLDENKALQEQIWLTQDLRDAYDRQTESIQSTIDEMKGLGDTLKDFRKSIYATDETALSTTQAMVKLMTTGALASTGDKTALGDLSTVGRDYLDAAKASAGSLLDYQRAQALVANYTDQAIAYTDNAVSEGEQQLALMKSQAESLISIDETTQSFEDALNKLIAHNQSTAASTSPPAQNTGQQGQGGSNNGNNDMRDGFDAMRRMFEQMLRKWNQMAPEGPMQVEVVS